MGRRGGWSAGPVRGLEKPKPCAPNIKKLKIRWRWRSELNPLLRRFRSVARARIGVMKSRLPISAVSLHLAAIGMSLASVERKVARAGHPHRKGASQAGPAPRPPARSAPSRSRRGGLMSWWRAEGGRRTPPSGTCAAAARAQRLQTPMRRRTCLSALIMAILGPEVGLGVELERIDPEPEARRRNTPVRSSPTRYSASAAQAPAR